mmetsp:Transcript_26940/g.55013  ORF Transcript_26940/g.55013 Transcript_26940/m.55013 type:complete len:477 (-) Transcript_26940:231-1661(-)
MQQFTYIPSTTFTPTGDIVIHLPDPNPNKAHEMRKLIWDYVWDGQETGGHYEGLRSISLVPGTGMLVNGDSKQHNLLPRFPSVDNGGLKRGFSAGAGAITHHHNFTWMVEHDLEAGDEFFVDYGPGWFQERGFADTSTPKKWDVDFLRQHGYCLDNVVPGASLLEGAGRGAFASRDIHAGTIIAPVPVIALSKGSLETMKERTDGTVVKSEQLLKNYCYGHPDSDLLLYPYSHGINLVNHHSTKSNVKLRWWNDSSPYFNRTLLELQQSSRLMFELVATNPIKKGDEIYMDYGDEWDNAWQNHMESWRPDPNNFHVSAETMNNNDDFHVLRTENEQQLQPYPQDVFTSCYYRYSDNNLLKPNQKRSMVVWKPTNGMISLRNLRPCRIIQRDPMTNFTSSNNQVSSHIYTVIVMNRPGLKESERIPKGHVHVVSHVPRNAIVFSEKVYTSDQHLPDAFRKEIGLGDLFPSQWKNLRN